MKKVIFITALVAIFTSNLLAQANLQLNDIVNLKDTKVGNGTKLLLDSTITVPAGKTWKIESVSIGQHDISVGYISYYSNTEMIVIDNTLVNSNNVNDTPSLLPLWLKEGEHRLNFVASSSTDGFTNYSYLITILEFNIVPE